MNTNRLNEILRLRQFGLSYSQIGEQLGLSRQRIQQIITPRNKANKTILEKANGICQICHRQVAKLDIHHVDYVKNEIVVVCVACHRDLHSEHLSKVIRVDKELYAALKILAKADKRTVIGEIRYLTQLYKNTKNSISIPDFQKEACRVSRN